MSKSVDYFKIKKPCNNCPFTRDTNFTFNSSRAKEIIYADGGFSCHKTTTEKGVGNNHKDARACAGRLIMLERSNQPDQMMRISERFGFYDPKELDMENPAVFESIEEFMEVRVD